MPDSSNPDVAVAAHRFDGTTTTFSAPTYTDQALFSYQGLALKGDIAPNGDGTGRFHRFEVDFTNLTGSLVVDNMGLARLSAGGFIFDFWPKDVGPDGRVDFYPIDQPDGYTGATGALAPVAGDDQTQPDTGDSGDLGGTD